MADTLDIRDPLFSSLRDRMFRATITATRAGLVAGMEEALQQAQSAGVEAVAEVRDGQWVAPGDVLLTMRGGPKAMAVAEDYVLGPLMMASGWATRAAELRRIAGRTRVVCGGWKKIPHSVKPLLHRALVSADVGLRIVDEPFVYIDKNYVRMFGGIREALAAAAVFSDRVKVIQVRGERTSIRDEAAEALEHGADVIMVDTGSLEDLAAVCETARSYAPMGARVAFAGGVTSEVIMVVTTRFDVYAVDVGSAILDAPLLDLRFDIET
ncbi:beta/alpha barrel domain-containing protein [Alicyclobacillus vulcanalis]|uniref:Nicotinate-nucleotide pyrophosphorylase (Carboxylating) n=1 Tax=Alicyclobacillus vulcanalis TaxID=252246 RepID=A0A1N7N7F6_9BACL|nr:hypothetical protein [Alicyclobacillus vulcanalis]SIS94303.1 nicotinate-nucleotide pyrophosphorylase (carboxylating) [Alicyclobacillus vulcanalis]